MAQNPERSIETANAYAAGNIGNLDEAWTRRLVASVVDTESSGGNLRADNGFGYYGRYQAGAGWLVDAGLVNRDKYDAALKASGAGNDWSWGEQGGAQSFLSNPANWNNGLSLDRYLGSAELQDQAFRTNSNASYNQAVRNGVLSADSEPNVVAGFLKARHLGGYDNAVDAAQGQGNVQDANGTSTGKYYNDIARNNDGFDRNFVPNFVRKETEITVNPLSDGVLKRGESGDAVKELQQKLTAAGFSTQGADGVYGQNTADAVKAFQQARNLTADGIAGPRTLESLGMQVSATQPQPDRPEPTNSPTTPSTPTQPAPAPAPAPANPAADQSWPAPGNFTVNRADKPGEGEGEFGTSRGGGARTHKGIDINGREGDPIESMRPGKVTFAGDGGAGAGNMIIIDHGGGLETRYLHLKSINVQEGQQVTENTKIGTMGRTGNTPDAGDTHLHFETRENGVAVDPRKYLNFPARDVLQQGDEGKDVTRLQEALVRNGATIKPDGDFGAGTKAAVEAFQRSNNLTPDGIAGPATQRALGVTQEQTPTAQPTTPAPTPTTPSSPSTPAQSGAMSDGVLKQGEQGEDVRKLQEALNKNGARLEADSNFGPATKAALENYQRSHNLDPDGVAGPKTLAALGMTAQQQAAQSTPPPPATAAPSPTATDKPQVPAPANVTPATPAAPVTAGNNHGHSHDHPATPPTATDKPQTPTPGNVTPTTPAAPSTAGNNHGHAHDHPATPPTATDKPQTTPNATDKPLISNPNHPDNKLYQQAVSNLEQLGPSGGFKSREDLEKAAAAVAVDAKATGLQSIDHISKTNAPNGQSYLVAVQGDPTSPAAKNSYIDYNQATTQTVAQSTGMAEAQKPVVQQAQAPAAQQTDPQLEPVRIAAGGR